MSKSWLKFFTLSYGFIELIFNFSQLIIARIVYLIIKPNSILTSIFFIIVLFISCALYYLIIKFLFKKIRVLIKPLDKFLITIEEFDKEFQRKNKNY